MPVMQEIGFSVGSNLGDREARLAAARDGLLSALDARGGVYSPLYETEPVGVKEEYRERTFLNAVVILETDRTAEDWLEVCRRLEQQGGRERGEDRYAPRAIDIDIIFAGNRFADGRHLNIPHPRWMKRRFVVQPLADLRPDLVLPGAGARSVRDVLEGLEDASGVRLVKRAW